ncbi:hypothetical protein [Streptomyces sp. KN37]|uniref:hypothetical protein n=1 Tax=Streptomyces sp. KN37 TaxID=3090667 RepID=UPI002A76103A|nr:hypothetical protein [Streptomyces sp. KN37]WPO73981.1 hypothetical protein R9806_26865 [Streptomyces sp. KN37]
MSTTSPTIPKETARHVLWMYDRLGGIQPGSCTEHLIRAMQTADVYRSGKLREAFPELSEAVHLARYDDEGIAKLTRIARGLAPLGCPNCGDEDGPFDAKTGRCETCAEAAA